MLVDASAQLHDCLFIQNVATNEGQGGGLSLFHSVNADGLSSPVAQAIIRNCTFVSNRTDYAGGGIGLTGYNWNNPATWYESTIRDCLFQGNLSAYGGGLAHRFWSLRPEIRNCLFDGNSATGFGAGILLYWTYENDEYQAPAEIENCTVVNSGGTNSSAVDIWDWTIPTIRNSIIWSNRTAGSIGYSAGAGQYQSIIEYSCVEGGYDGPGAGPGILSVNPLFAGSPSGNVRLAHGSRCVDAGSEPATDLALGWQNGYGTDKDGVRGDAGIVDMGYHYAGYTASFDSDNDGLPDWWEEQHFGGLTGSATNDTDEDGLDSLEEYYYRYSPTNSERFLYHSPWRTVFVSTNTPNPGPDEGNERFDFSGIGRPLSLASNSADNGWWGIFGESSSGGIYFNNDESNLYVGEIGRAHV